MSRKDELEGRLSSAASELSMWKGLVATAGWLKLQKTMEAQRNTRIITVGGQPLLSFNQALPQEYMKGEANGIGLPLTFPYTQIELLQLEVTSLTVALEQEQDNVQTSGTSDEPGSRVDSQQWHGSDDTGSS